MEKKKNTTNDVSGSKTKPATQQSSIVAPPKKKKRLSKKDKENEKRVKAALKKMLSDYKKDTGMDKKAIQIGLDCDGISINDLRAYTNLSLEEYLKYGGPTKRGVMLDYRDAKGKPQTHVSKQSVPKLTKKEALSLSKTNQKSVDKRLQALLESDKKSSCKCGAVLTPEERKSVKSQTPPRYMWWLCTKCEKLERTKTSYCGLCCTYSHANMQTVHVGGFDQQFCRPCCERVES